MSWSKKRLAVREFVPLVASILSLAALSIDAMLPAMRAIAADLGALPNQAQFVITSMFAGFALGQLVYGPLSDSIGRKPALFLGIVLFVLGCGLSALSTNFPMMIVGRLLQGIGASAPRIISVALVRDEYEGEEMARIMSLIMAVFVMVPAVAPALGQLVMDLSHWRVIFVVMVTQAVLTMTWLSIRQAETLRKEHRRALSLQTMTRDCGEVLHTRATMGYTAASGLVFGAFVAYLSIASQLFDEVFGITRTFPIYFAMLAGSIGIASTINSRLVMRLGMRPLSVFAAQAMTALSLIFLLVSWAYQGRPPPDCLHGVHDGRVLQRGVADGEPQRSGHATRGAHCGNGRSARRLDFHGHLFGLRRSHCSNVPCNGHSPGRGLWPAERALLVQHDLGRTRLGRW